MRRLLALGLLFAVAGDWSDEPYRDSGEPERYEVRRPADDWTGDREPDYEYRFEQRYQQQRQREQQLQHGAGGCTPNFATGGCLE